MCYEPYLRRLCQEAEESRAIWQEFDRTTPISDPEPRDIPEAEPTERERAETLAASEQ